MIGRPSRETIIQALLDDLVASLSTTLTADTKIGSNVLLNVNATGGLYEGLPVVGAGLPPLSLVTSLSPLTLSQPAIANASQVSLKTGILYSSRRVQHWDQTQVQPALFVRDPEEDSDYKQGILQQLSVDAQVLLYSNIGQIPTVAPGTGLNNLIDALQAAMAPDDPVQQRYTINGLVFWARISGRILKDPGDLDGQAIALVPVEIIVP